MALPRAGARQARVYDRAMRKLLETLRREARFLAELRFLPPRVALFQWRAWRLAWRTGDRFSQVSGTRPRKLAALLRAAQGRRRVVELGTGTAWTTISLALADRQRTLLSFDPIERPEREWYLRLASPGTRRRLTFVCAPGDRGPGESDMGPDKSDTGPGKSDTGPGERARGVDEGDMRPGGGCTSSGGAVDLLYIDSSHEREPTIREVHAWQPVLGEGAVVVFDDYGHPGYPGVQEAIGSLGLKGEEQQGLFIHRAGDTRLDVQTLDRNASKC